MNKSIQVLGDGMAAAALVPGVRFGVTALELAEGVTYEDWERVGLSLMAMGRSHAWWIGDWLNYGEQHFGERYAQAMESTGLDYQTLRDCVYVSNQVGVSRRRDTLSWSHHREVAAMETDEQNQWLDLAEAEGWSRAELRSEIRKSRHLLAEAEVVAQSQVSGGAGHVTEQDAIDFLNNMQPESADLLLTDPPYMTDVPDIAAFAVGWVPLALSRVKRSGRAYICTGPYPEELQAYLGVLLAQDDFKIGNILIWTYRNTLGPSPNLTYKNNWQAVFYLYGPDAQPLNSPLMTEQFSVQDISAPDGRIGDRYHAWQKPADLAEIFIRHATEPGAVVIDPFTGTGTFLAAAARLGRFGLGSDNDPEMLNICKQRGLEVRHSD